MKIAMIGTGYVGLVTGACFADSGNEVTCIDIDEAKIEQLSQGKVPIYEPGLQEVVLRNSASGRLHFTTRVEESVKAAQVIFLAVNTPVGEDGTPDCSALWSVLDQIAPHLSANAVVVIKSTVPVGTNAQACARLQQKTGRSVDVASNPEFLKEGAAMNDVMFPDRVLVGVRNAAVADTLRELYAPFLRTDKPFLVMSPESAEMTPLVANALLATKISFINEMANLCELLEADMDAVRRGIGHDQRIGFAYLFPGAGYGGSCLPQDVRALGTLARRLGMEPRILDAVEDVNDCQKKILFDKIHAHFEGDLRDKTIAIWGVAFKPRTDDVRHAPALVLIDQLLRAGARISVHDPEATNNVREIYGDQLRYGTHPMDVLVGADALVIATAWGEYGNPDFAEMRRRLATPLVFDGRNVYIPQQMAELGFTYYGIGRCSGENPARSETEPAAITE